MTKEAENPKNSVERSVSGGFTAVWNGQTVYEKGRVKKFETEDAARVYLRRCDEAGKIIR
jgi:hypothetical protein